MKKSIHNELVLTSCQANCGKSKKSCLDNGEHYTYNPNTPVKNFRVPRKELLPKMDIVALCNHWF